MLFIVFADNINVPAKDWLCQVNESTKYIGAMNAINFSEIKQNYKPIYTQHDKL